jgi:hypothetical protein
MQTDKSECLTLVRFFQDILSEGKPTLLEQLFKVGSLHYPQILDQDGKAFVGTNNQAYLASSSVIKKKVYNTDYFVNLV